MGNKSKTYKAVISINAFGILILLSEFAFVQFLVKEIFIVLDSKIK